MSLIEIFLANKIDILAAIIGLIYLYLEYKANIFMWLVSIIMAILFIAIFYYEGIYGNMTIYIYFLGASVYGWYAWIKAQTAQKISLKNEKENTQSIQIKRLQKKQWSSIIIACLLVAVVIYPLLRLTGEKQSVLMLDTASTALQMIALLMSTKRFAEQWLLLVPANLFSAIIMLMQQNYATSIMFIIYAVVSVAGYANWKRLAKKEKV